jgi:signal peptidase I
MVLLAGLFVARITHWFEYRVYGTNSDMPTHKGGSLFFASKLIAPDYGKFVCFRNYVTQNLFVFRVIGKPNDVIEIKDAIVYRNGQKLDEPYTWNEYQLTKAQYQNIEGFIKQNNNDVQQPTDSLYLVALSDGELKQYHLKLAKHVTPKGLPDAQLLPEWRDLKYNADNLGPIKIPADSYFLMGDDRHNALDSRYLGFIKSKDIVSTVLGN